MSSFDLDSFLRHQIYGERLASQGINAVVKPSLRETYLAVRRILLDYYTIPNQRTLEAILKQLSQAIQDNGGWLTLTKDYLVPFGVAEASWMAEYTALAVVPAGVAIKTPAEKVIESYIAKSIMTWDGKNPRAGRWLDFAAANIQSREQAINSAVMRGYSRGDTIRNITAEIRNVTEGLLFREAETLARTGFAHYASQANEAMTQANSDVLEEYYYSVTFDNRTSDTCLGVTRFNQPGQRFKVGDTKAPAPPLHPNCRTRRLAVPKGTTPGGTRSAVGGQSGEDAEKAFNTRQERIKDAQEQRRELGDAAPSNLTKSSQVKYRGSRDTNIFKPGQVSASETYGDWLRKQPEWFVVDTLGKQKAELFLKGNLPIYKFTDVELKPLTLDELKRRYSKEWRKAFG